NNFHNLILRLIYFYVKCSQQQLATPLRVLLQYYPQRGCNKNSHFMFVSLEKIKNVVLTSIHCFLKLMHLSIPGNLSLKLVIASRFNKRRLE
ncbi:hypothetical protein L9F63_026885, partial [Diploptera punctata]